MVSLMSSRYTFKNYSVKSGYVDKIEYVPQTLESIPVVEIVHFDKEQIGWRQERTLEIKYRMIVNLNALAKAIRPETREIRVEAKLYDNTGKLIATTPNGLHTPIMIGLVFGISPSGPPLIPGATQQPKWTIIK